MGKDCSGGRFGVGIDRSNITENLMQQYALLGFDHIEWRWRWDGKGCTPIPEYEELVRMEKLCSKYGFSLSIHGPNGLSVAEKIDPLRCVSISIWKEMRAVAEQIGAQWLVIELGSVGCSTKNRKKKQERAKIAAYALEEILKDDSCTTKVLVENMKLLNNDRISYLGDDACDLTTVITNLPTQGAGIVFDTGHAMINNNPKQFYEKVKPYIMAFHVHINHGSKDEHLPIDAFDNKEQSAFWRNVYKDYLDGIPLICEFQVDKEKREYLNILKKMGECNTQ